MGKKHAAGSGGGGGWFAVVRKVFRPSSSSSATTSKDKDAVQHGKQVGAPPGTSQCGCHAGTSSSCHGMLLIDHFISSVAVG